MKRRLISRESIVLPESFDSLLSGADIYDSSCSQEARVIFVDKGCGYYLKSAPVGSLKKEALMSDYFHKKGLSSALIEYISADKDYLLTERVLGEDCTYRNFLDNPKRLATVIGESLRMLHELDFSDCPIKNRMGAYFDLAEENYSKGAYDLSYFKTDARGITADDVWRIASSVRSSLKSDTLLHGDYCLPNIMLDNWKLSGFIDLGGAGVGDKHVDLFWGAWTLNYNLNTDKYRDVFFDAYGKTDIDFDILEAIGAIECFG